MNVNVSASRRSFLKGSAAAGLVIALRLPVSNAAAAARRRAIGVRFPTRSCASRPTAPSR